MTITTVFNVTGECETFLQDPKEHRSFLYNTLKDDASEAVSWN